MALPLPNLDDRRWADLVDEARAMVPRNAPQWTDHNAHDPGITLVELFAWIAEQGLFRLNQVPDRHRLKFLRLIGFSPRPPRPARTLLALAPSSAASLAVPAGALFEGGAPAVAFRTRRAVQAQPAALRAILVDRGDGVLRDGTADLRDADQLLVFGKAPRTGSALYLGFEQATPGLALSLGVEVLGPHGDDDERERLRREAEARRSDCAPPPSWPCPDASPPAAEGDEDVLPHHSARLAWEVLSGTSPETWTVLELLTGPDTPPPGGVRDDTRAFTLDGGLELNLPASAVEGALGPVAAPLFYVRARLVGGAWDAPPALTALVANGVWADQCRPLWRELTIAASVPPPASPPANGTTTRVRLTLDGADVVTALAFDPTAADAPPVTVFDYQPPDPLEPGRLAIDAAVIARGHGFPEQELRLPAAPLVAGSVRVHTHDGTAWQAWPTRADLDASRRTDFHLALDAVEGRLLAGDGERGRVLPAGVPVLAAADVTAAQAGNVPAGTIVAAAAGSLSSAWLAAPADIAVSQPRPAVGGAARERIGDAARRAAETLLAHERLVALAEAGHRSTLDQLPPAAVRAARAPRRALTLLDYERLALDVPGTRVARARAWAGQHPAWPCPGVAGLVTVVVVPDTPVRRPLPSEGLLAAVRAYLDRRRTVGTRVEVVAPRYVVVRVTARVRKRRLADAKRVQAQVRAALDAFLDPRAGGPAGRGWPFGRDVFRTEVLQVIDEIDGVDYVEELTLRAGEGTPRCGNVEVCPAWLVAPGAHQVDVR